MTKTEYCLGFCFSTLRHRVVLIKKLKPEWQRDKWNGVGGKLEPGESPLDAMRREFKEETGSEVNDWERYCLMEGESWLVHCFRAFEDVKVSAPTDELTAWIDMHVNFYEMMPLIPNLRWLIPMALDKDRLNGRVIYFHI
jgi:8-oxo-dGTP diphosphatase